MSIYIFFHFFKRIIFKISIGQSAQRIANIALQANHQVVTDVLEAQSLQELVRLSRLAPARIFASDRVASTGASISQLLLKRGSFDPISSGNSITWQQFTTRSVTQFSSSAAHVLVCCADGSLYSWGSNSCGQLGKPQTITYTSEPQLVLESQGIVCVSAGLQHSIAVSVHGALFSPVLVYIIVFNRCCLLFWEQQH